MVVTRSHSYGSPRQPAPCFRARRCRVGRRDASRVALLGEVEIGVDYAIIINNNAGLWGYNLGDSVRFTSLSPYKLLVSGRIKHFISAFGEHVIGKEVETALMDVTNSSGIKVIELPWNS